MVLSGFSYTTLQPNVNQHWLWYDKYKYKVCFDLKQIGIHRNYDLEIIQSELLRSNLREAYVKNLIEIKKFLIWKSANDDYIKTLKHVNSITVYSTRYDIIEDLAKILGQPNTVEEVLVNFSRPKEIIYHKNPKHNFRIYLKSRVYSHTELIELRDFFTKYKKHFFPSPNFNFYMHWDANNKNGRWIGGDLFFDYDDEHMQSLFYMTFHECIKKEYSIQKPPEVA
jgi:hypothetical protein